ncbi:MAG: hypothetical protein IPG71_07760 [bacterium]|nr:hypothetical protein [bacterium]
MIRFLSLMLCGAALTVSLAVAGERPVGFGKSSKEEILQACYDKIQWYIAQDIEVPESVYDFYFSFEQLVMPEVHGRRVPGAFQLDELQDACPGTSLTFETGGGEGDGEVVVIVCGQTSNARNDCGYPTCRWGKDVVVELNVEDFGYFEITTTGSLFDTYLCLYEDGCCGDPDAELIEANDNNPGMCNGQRLASGFSTCLDDGTYYLVLDGSFSTARGSYCLTIYYDEGFCD